MNEVRPDPKAQPLNAYPNSSDGKPFELPSDVVSALTAQERTSMLVSAISGIIIALLISLFVTFFVKHDDATAQLFNLRKGTGIIPLVIVAMALWSVIWCWRRVKFVQSLREASDTGFVGRAIARLNGNSSDPATTLLSLLPAYSDISPVLSRLSSILQQWKLEPGIEQADVVCQNHLFHDEERIDKSYNLVRIFVWAMPVLGLIGTVVGISGSVSGFATFLAGGVDNVETIKSSLIGVTRGLSFAFLITMLGLVGALVAMLLSNGLQSQEEAIIAEVQKSVTDRFLPALQSAAPRPTAGMEPFELHNRDLDPLIEGVSNLVGGIHALASAWDRTVEQKIDSFLNRISETTKAASDALSESSVQASTQLSQELQRIMENVVVQQENWSQQHSDALNSITLQSVAAQKEAIQQITRIGDAFAEGQNRWLTSANQLSENLDQRQQNVDKRVDELRLSASEMVGVMNVIAASQQAVAESVSKLQIESELSRSLVGVQDALSSLQPFLYRLTAPMVLTLAPPTMPNPVESQSNSVQPKQVSS